MISEDVELITTYSRFDANIEWESSNEDVIDDEEFIANEIVFSKTKFVNLSKMTPEDAIEQMIYIGHDFYLFKNPITNTTDIVYKRKDTAKRGKRQKKRAYRSRAVQQDRRIGNIFLS